MRQWLNINVRAQSRLNYPPRVLFLIPLDPRPLHKAILQRKKYTASGKKREKRTAHEE